ncbi:hypothetical protein KKA15_05585 [Patescibacteria group bacterium]|nr:hypothetical protein [Patescibacteria group bacterium]
MINKKEREKLDDIMKKSRKNLEYSQSKLDALKPGSGKDIEEIKELLESNLEFSKTIYKGIIKIHHWMFWHRILGILKWIIIIIPIIVGAIYLPPLFREVFDKWQEAFTNINLQ